MTVFSCADHALWMPLQPNKKPPAF